MEWQELLVDGYGRALETLEKALDGLTPEDLDKRPCEDCNSMGWLAWHLARVQDHQLSDLAGAEQLWIKEAWHRQFGREPDANDIGFGHSSADVAAFRSPAPEVLLDYYRAVMDNGHLFIRGLTPDDLDRELNEPWFQPLPTVGVRLISVMSDCLQHAGQVAYLRGMLKGKGWLGY
jgi:hypothetical protein